MRINTTAVEAFYAASHLSRVVLITNASRAFNVAMELFYAFEVLVLTILQKWYETIEKQLV